MPSSLTTLAVSVKPGCTIVPAASVIPSLRISVVAAAEIDVDAIVTKVRKKRFSQMKQITTLDSENSVFQCTKLSGTQGSLYFDKEQSCQPLTRPIQWL